jgi:hypothetical protein
MFKIVFFIDLYLNISSIRIHSNVNHVALIKNRILCILRCKLIAEYTVNIMYYVLNRNTQYDRKKTTIEIYKTH